MNTIAELRASAYSTTAVDVDGYYIEGDGGGGRFDWDPVCALPDDGGATILPDGWQGPGRWRRRIDNRSVVDVRWFGAHAAPGFIGYVGTTGLERPNADAFEAACRSLTPDLIAAPTFYGPTVLVPSGRYDFTRSLIIDRSVSMLGVGDEVMSSTWLQFPADVDGIVLWQDLPPPFPPPSPPLYKWPRAMRSLLRGLKVRGTVGPDMKGAGVLMEAAASIGGCFIENFGGNGIDIDCTAPNENGNGWEVYRTRVTGCHHGLYTDGADSNAGRSSQLSVIGNRGWGIYDSSFLSNSHCDAHAATNALGSYKSDNPNARTSFRDCYHEGDQPPAQVDFPAFFENGNVPNVGTGGTLGQGLGSLALRRNDATIQNATDPASVVEATLGGKLMRAALQLKGAGSSQRYSLRHSTPQPGGYASSVGWWAWEWAGVVRGIALAFCDGSAPEYNEGKGGAKAWVQNGLYFGHTTRIMVTDGTAAPTSGVWHKGDRVMNSAPVPGGFAGWICTTASAPNVPAVFKGFGFIEQ